MFEQHYTPTVGHRAEPLREEAHEEPDGHVDVDVRRQRDGEHHGRHPRDGEQHGLTTTDSVTHSDIHE